MKRPAWTLVALVSIGLGALGAQSRFKSSTTLVRLEVEVSDDRGNVGGLGVADFVVEDRGKRQQIQVQQITDAPLDLALVAPSRSAVAFVAADQTDRFAAGVSAFLDLVQQRDRLAVVLADAPPKVLRFLETGRDGVDLGAFEAGRGGYSTTLDGVGLGLRLFDRAERRRAVVTFTNGADFRSVVRADDLAEVSRWYDPTLVLVGLPISIDQRISFQAELRDGRPVGDPIEGALAGSVLPRALEQLAQKTGSALINLGDEAPASLMRQMFDRLRTYYVISYEIPAGQGWHAVKVKVNRRGVKVAARPGYMAE